jgi:hypothetical protein
MILASSSEKPIHLCASNVARTRDDLFGSDNHLPARELLAQPSQCKSGKEQPEITQRHIKVAGNQQQVYYD